MHNDSWPLIRSLLEKTLNPSQFTLWIAPLSALVEGETLTLTAPNPFVADWVRERLASAITEAAAQVLGDTPRLVITAAETPSAIKRQSAQLLNLPLRQDRPWECGTPAPAGCSLPNAGAADQNTDCAGPWRFCFSDFVVGPSNDLAFAAAKSITRTGLSDGQLFLCSAAGLGKTHLVQAVGQAVLQTANTRQVRVRYLTAEEFATNMILALKSGDIAGFKTRFREHVDLLLMEDVHFLQGKDKIQGELLSTLKALRERGSRVVFTSSFLPREMTDLDDHLLSRLSAGVIAYIDRPDFDTRCRILEEKARKMQVSVPKDVGALVAETIDSDVRQLESCLRNLVLKAKLLNKTISMDLAREVLAHYTRDKGVCVMERIVLQVCKTYGLTAEELASKSRRRNIVQARNTAFFLARKHTPLSLKAIGQRFGRRHSTVIKGITCLEKEMSKRTPEGRQLKQALEHIRL